MVPVNEQRGCLVLPLLPPAGTDKLGMSQQPRYMEESTPSQDPELTFEPLNRGNMHHTESFTLFPFKGFYAEPRRRQWYPAPVLLPGKSHGRRSLVGCSPWGREESDVTE